MHEAVVAKRTVGGVHSLMGPFIGVASDPQIPGDFRTRDI